MPPKRKATIQLDPIADYGPSVKRGKDGRLQFFGAADVILEDRPDPTITERKQLVRGARRSTTLAEMFNRNVITKPMHDAAVRFLDDLSWATGGSGCGMGEGIRVAPGSRDAMPERQMNAIGRVRRVMTLLGLNSDTVLWWVVVSNRSCSAFDERFRLREGTAAHWLRASLQALDNHYNPPGRAKSH